MTDAFEKLYNPYGYTYTEVVAVPDQAAHYFFMRKVFAELDEAHAGLFDANSMACRIGSFGPDPLFNDFNSCRRSEGFRLHKCSGRTCMERMRAPVRNGVTFAVEYAAGFFTHYALDRLCHPDILIRVENGDAPHLAYEAAYDRLLQQRYHFHFPSRLSVSEEELKAAALMYETVRPAQLKNDIDLFWKLRMMLLKSGGTPLSNVPGIISREWKGIIPYAEPSNVIMAGVDALDHTLNGSIAYTARRLEVWLDAVYADTEFEAWLDADFSGRDVNCR